MATTITAETRLRLRAEFSVIPLPDEKVLLRSPDQGVRVSVAGWKSEQLAGLLRALDGRPSSVRRIFAGGANTSDVERLLRGLIQRDIVELDPCEPPVSNDERLFAHFHEDPRECARRLESGRVLVCGEGSLSEAVVRDLRAAGVGSVTRMCAADGVRGSSVTEDAIDRTSLVQACRSADLVMVASEVGDARSPDEILVNDLAIESGFAWLPIRIFGSQGFVGPLFIPGDGPCHACLLAREEANWVDPTLTRTYLDRLRDTPGEREAYGRLPGFAAITSAWGAIEATKFLSRFTMPTALGNVLCIDFIRCTVRLHRVLRLPHCARCSSLTRRPFVNSLLYARAQ
jgi:bacteriocin biosynthesis cyclodehydratase domain-containing protein